MLESFKNPKAKYRAKPFWFWNGDMNDEEIKHQIIEMKEKGLGGFFICARQGLKIPYMSKAWLKKVKFACDEAKKQGLEAWLYDEYPYPSGMAGGEILQKHPEAEHYILKHHVFEVDGEAKIDINIGWEEILYAKAIPYKFYENNNLDWENAIDIKDDFGNLQTTEIYQKTGLTKYNRKRFFTYDPTYVYQGNLPKGKWKIEIYTQVPLGEFKYYGGFFDPCDKDAVSTFLESTHEKYKKILGEHFGTEESDIKGIFSDETGFLSPIPWSKLLPKAFFERCGYDLLSVLPALHNADYENAYKIRYDLYQTAHLLFQKNYHKQISDWCEENSLMYATEVPSMRLSTQRYSHVTGGDTAHEKLGKSLEWIYDEYLKNYRNNEYAVSSLARQCDREYAMIESFHSIGWSMTLQDAKCMIDRLGAGGINLYNFHAFYYTIQSIVKHDAPPSQFLQNPYWKHYKLFADYVARMSAFITETESTAHVAVIDSAVSFWVLLGNPFHGFIYKGTDKKEEEQLQYLRDSWVHICKTLLFSHIRHDLLDTEILNENNVINGNIEIGKAKYDTLILPKQICMEAHTKKILDKFINGGGKLLVMGEFPNIVFDGEADFKNYENKENVKIFNTKDFSIQNTEKLEMFFKENINEKINFEVSEIGKKSIVSTVREDKEKNIYVFIGNQSKNKIDVKLENKNAKSANEISFETGTNKNTKIVNSFNNGILKLELLPYESKCIKFENDSANSDYANQTNEEYSEIVLSTQNEMPVQIDGQNICRLEKFLISRDKKNWLDAEAETIIERIANTEKTGKTGKTGIGGILSGDDFVYSSDFGIPKKAEIKYPFLCWYKMDFEIEKIPSVLNFLHDKETITSDYKIWINGHELQKDAWENCFVNDQNNMKTDIKSFVQNGKNEILIQANIEKSSDGIRDVMYLTGDFEIIKKGDAGYILSEPKNIAKLRNSFISGYPFYSGTFIFNTVFSVKKNEMKEKYKITLDIGDDIHDVIEILINGKSLGTRAFAPNCWYGDTKGLNEGENEVCINVTNTLSNMLDGTYFDYNKHCLIEIDLMK